MQLCNFCFNAYKSNFFILLLVCVNNLYISMDEWIPPCVCGGQVELSQQPFFSLLF